MSSEAFEQKHNDEACNYEKVKNKNVKAEKIPEQSGTIAIPSTSKMANSNAHISISNLTNDHDIERDAEFFDKCQQIMTDNNTKLFIFYISQFRAAYQKDSIAQLRTVYIVSRSLMIVVLFSFL